MSSGAGKKLPTLDTDFLLSIIESVPLMVFVKDATTLRFELVNRAAEVLLGRTREELIGRTDRDFFTEEQVRFFNAKDREALASPNAIDVREEPISTPQGVRWLRTMKKAIRDEAGAACHLLGISEDITAERELARALEQTEEKLRQAHSLDQIGKLAGGIAHDFNNMIAVIISYADLAMDSLRDGDPVREDLAEIARAGARAADLTGQLLAFSYGQTLATRVLDLNDVIEGMERMFRRVLEASIELTSALAPDLWKISADPSGLGQILMNLVVNARAAMPNGGRLILETANVEIDAAFAQTHPGASEGPHVMLAVSDTGSGMDRETLARVFEPFFTTKPAGVGTGLGLWNVYSIVRQLGGTIWAYSELGTGTTFKVYLPRADLSAMQSKPSEPPATSATRGSETVLVVEDEEQLLRLVESVLRRNGYKVLAARSPAEALLVSEQYNGEIDLLLTDVIMPLLSGAQLADRLHVTRPSKKVAFMSGYTAKALDRQLGRGVVLIQKPFSTFSLLHSVRAALL